MLNILETVRTHGRGVVSAVGTIAMSAPLRRYPLKALGPAVFWFGDELVVREDFELVNARGERLACSWWRARRFTFLAH